MTDDHDSDVLVRVSVAADAARRGVDPDAAVALVDRSLLRFDERGEPLNVLETMDALLDAKPYLTGSLAVEPARLKFPGGPIRGLARMQQAVRDATTRDRVMRRRSS